MSISIDLIAGERRALAVLGTSVSALRLERLLPLELELGRSEGLDGALCARLPRPLGAWLERADRPALLRGSIVLRPQSEELCVLLEAWPAERAAGVNYVGQMQGDLTLLEGAPPLRLMLQRTRGPGAGRLHPAP